MEPQRLFIWSLHLDWLGHSHSIEGARAVKQLHEVWSFKSPSNPDRRCMAFRTWPEYITSITTDVLYRWTWLQKPRRGGGVDPASQWRRARIFRRSLKAPQSIRSANGKESTCQCRRGKRYRLSPWVGRILWSRGWQPTPVCLPGKFQRSLADYSPWDPKDLDMAEHICLCCWQENSFLMYFSARTGVKNNKDEGLFPTLPSLGKAVLTGAINAQDNQGHERQGMTPGGKSRGHGNFTWDQVHRLQVS